MGNNIVLRWLKLDRVGEHIYTTASGAAALSDQTATIVNPSASGFLSRPGAEIHCEVSGRPAIVFAHGLGGNHMSWFQQVPYFAQQHTCVGFASRLRAKLVAACTVPASKLKSLNMPVSFVSGEHTVFPPRAAAALAAVVPGAKLESVPAACHCLAATFNSVVGAFR